jgi:pantoate--beta-alanine ligase
LDDDVRMCAEAGADIVFAPEPPEMYPADFSTFVEETKLSKGLCGASRPTHFRGVTTVVAKLLNIVQPDRAYFGRKDAQQAAVIKRMVRDLDFPVEIIVMPTVREPDGLAMSSRNKFLKGAHRREALVLSTALKKVEAAFAAGEKRASALKEIAARAVASAADARVDYIEVVDAENLEPAAVIARPALVALAVFVGDTRLIDNVTLVP